MGDIHYDEVFQPVISGSRIYGRNQQIMPHYSSSLSASLFKAYSSSLFNVDLDNQVEQATALFNRNYAGVKNTKKTTLDGGLPIEVIITAPSKLVTTKDSDSTLTTGEGIVSKFKEVEDEKDKFDPVIITEDELLEEPKIEGKPRRMKNKKLRGLKGLAKLRRGTVIRPITDADIMREIKKAKRERIADEAKFESSSPGSKGKGTKQKRIRVKKKTKKKKKK